MASPDIYWEGASGKKYGYWIYKMGTSFKDEPGNYIYAKETQPNRWSPVYIGQTKSLKDRLADHEKEDCAVRHGATHIQAHINGGGKEARLEEEADLVRKWEPACND